MVYVRGEDNSMAGALSRYPTTDVYSEDIAEKKAQHPHVNFVKDSLVVLNRVNQTTSPLTAITCLSQATAHNKERTRVRCSIDDETITKYEKVTMQIVGALSSFQLLKACLS